MHERPKIIVVCANPPWKQGGIERVVAETCRHLKDLFDISIYATSRSKEELGDHVWEDVKVSVFMTHTSTFCLSPSLYRNLAGKQGIALVHAHNFGTFIPEICAISKGATPLVVNPHFHEKGSTKINDLLKKLYDPLVGSYALGKADLIVCNSRWEENALLAKFPSLRTRTRVIHNGVHVEGIKNAQPFPSDRRVVLCVNRLLRYKNVHLVVRALEHLPGDYEAVVVGTGPEEGRLKDLAKTLGVDGRVRFLGRITDDDLYRWYRTATVFAHMSEMESFGMTCVEALAAGVPVVANNDGCGLKDTIDMFPPNIVAVDAKRDSPLEIGCAIERASHIGVRADLSHFGWDSVSSQFAEPYLQIIRARQDKLRAF